MSKRFAVLEGLIALSAVGGGMGLIATNGLAAPVSDLAGSPFGSYVVPGIALTLLVGGPMALASGACWRGAPAAPRLSVLAGSALLLFEVVEALALGGVRSPLQPAMTLLALAVLVSGARAIASHRAAGGRGTQPRTRGALILEAAADITRSPADVFDYCSDPLFEPEWNPMMTRAERLTSGPVGVGSRHRVEFARAPALVMRCVSYDRPSAWASVGESRALRAQGGGSVTPILGGAHLVMRMQLELRGPGRLAAPLLRHRMTSLWQRDLETIRRRLEGDGGRGAATGRGRSSGGA